MVFSAFKKYYRLEKKTKLIDGFEILMSKIKKI
jgi:hypothetical protein